jgi:hypothetical protein
MIYFEVIFTLVLIVAIGRLIATYLPTLSNSKLSFVSALFILTPCIVFYSLCTFDTITNFTEIPAWVFFILIAFAPLYAIIPLVIGVKSLMRGDETIYSSSGVILNALIILLSLYFYGEFISDIGDFFPIGAGG